MLQYPFSLLRDRSVRFFSIRFNLSQSPAVFTLFLNTLEHF